MKNFFLLLFLFIGINAFSQVLDCSSLRDGKFKYKNLDNSTTYIERKGDKQYEYREGGKEKILTKITWVDACTYQLKFKKAFYAMNPIVKKATKQMVLTAKIVAVSTESYRIEYTTNIIPGVNELEIFRIK